MRLILSAHGCLLGWFRVDRYLGKNPPDIRWQGLVKKLISAQQHWSNTQAKLLNKSLLQCATSEKRTLFKVYSKIWLNSLMNYYITKLKKNKIKIIKIIYKKKLMHNAHRPSATYVTISSRTRSTTCMRTYGTLGRPKNTLNDFGRLLNKISHDSWLMWSHYLTLQIYWLLT